MAFMEHHPIDMNKIKTSQEDLSHKFYRAQAFRECYKIANKISYYFTASQMSKMEGMFSKDPDTKITTPWGVYCGADAAERCFLKDFPDLEDENRKSELKGRLVIDTFCSPVIEVAGDGKTARGMWINPGIETHVEDGQGKAYWSWKRIAADFLNEKEEWKIWHLNILVCFNTPYKQDWASSEKKIFAPSRNSSDHQVEKLYYYNSDAILPEELFDPPISYETWQEIKTSF